MHEAAESPLGCTTPPKRAHTRTHTYLGSVAFLCFTVCAILFFAQPSIFLLCNPLCHDATHVLSTNSHRGLKLGEELLGCGRSCQEGAVNNTLDMRFVMDQGPRVQ